MLEHYINFDSCQARADDIDQGQRYFTTMSVSSCITSFPPFICLWDGPRFTALNNVAMDSAENPNLSFFIVMVIVLNQFPPLVLSQFTIGCLLKKVNKPARKCLYPLKAEI